MEPNRDNDSVGNTLGFTHVEVMIAAGIMAIVALAAVRFLTTLQSKQASMSAKSSAEKINVKILGRLEKEFLQRSLAAQEDYLSGYSIAPQGLGMAIRMNKKDDLSAQFIRRYQTRCQQIQVGSTAYEALKDATFMPPANNSDPNSGQCLRVRKCDKGSYPEISIVSVGSADINLSQIFPAGLSDGNYSIKQNTIGHCLLIRPISNFLEVVVDSVYYTPLESGAARPISIVSSKRLIPLGNFAGVRLIP